MAHIVGNVHVNDLPDTILSNIFSLVRNVRTRNAMSLVCLKWRSIERSTRTSLTLRGNIRDLSFLPTCFGAVTNLNLSLLSPYGYPLPNYSPNPFLLAQMLHRAFPLVVSLTVYALNPLALQLLAPQWPNLHHIKLIRWRQRSTCPLGFDFFPLLDHCNSLSSFDISQFYCWTEDLPQAIGAYPLTAKSLSHLNILSHCSSEGYKSHELLAITANCSNLQKLLATCIFNHRFIGFVGDETLLSLASNCPRLLLLHLIDSTSSSNAREPENDGYAPEEARITQTALGNLFDRLPLLEELVLDICNNVRDTWPALKLLNSKCPQLKSLKLGHFHGICRGVDSTLDGIALCGGLEFLSIKNSADLSDSGLVAISIGCSKLAKFEIQGCKKITATGIRELAFALRNTLIDVKISCCKNLNAVHSLQALEPIREQIQRLHIDCVWESIQITDLKSRGSRSVVGFKESQKGKRSILWEETSSTKISKIDFHPRTWSKLQYISLWIDVGDSIAPLAMSGLGDCPMLEEIEIKVEGDCRHRPRTTTTFGMSSLASYPRVSKMQLDCSAATGFALTAPSGHVDLSLWERFYLNGIGNLSLNELDYWPPQDMDVNQRSLSLPAVGLLAQCRTLRKLFIHGTANEHMMMFLLNIPNLRDVQLRQDYYPAPENDICTELRVESCCRFEDALNRRRIPD